MIVLIRCYLFLGISDLEVEQMQKFILFFKNKTTYLLIIVVSLHIFRYFLSGFTG